MGVKAKIEATKFFEKQLAKVPKYIRDKVLLWVYMVEQLGIEEVRKHKGYHDEPLLGKREGQRSIRLSKGYRLIYTQRGSRITIYLLEVSKHDY